MLHFVLFEQRDVTFTAIVRRRTADIEHVITKNEIILLYIDPFTTPSTQTTKSTSKINLVYCDE